MGNDETVEASEHVGAFAQFTLWFIVCVVSAHQEPPPSSGGKKPSTCICTLYASLYFYSTTF